MKKFLIISVSALVLIISGYFTFTYFASYSEGVRSGELIKFSHKGYVFKTWEGEISQGVTGSKTFSFSVLDADSKVISDLQALEGQYVRLSYEEKYKTFWWWGDTKYFVVAVKRGTNNTKIQQ
jgi:hypothetical protein